MPYEEKDVSEKLKEIAHSHYWRMIKQVIQKDIERLHLNLEAEEKISKVYMGVGGVKALKNLVRKIDGSKET